MICSTVDVGYKYLAPILMQIYLRRHTYFTTYFTTPSATTVPHPLFENARPDFTTSIFRLRLRSREKMEEEPGGGNEALLELSAVAR